MFSEQGTWQLRGTRLWGLASSYVVTIIAVAALCAGCSWTFGAKNRFLQAALAVAAMAAMYLALSTMRMLSGGGSLKVVADGITISSAYLRVELIIPAENILCAWPDPKWPKSKLASYYDSNVACLYSGWTGRAEHFNVAPQQDTILHPRWQAIVMDHLWNVQVLSRHLPSSKPVRCISLLVVRNQDASSLPTIGDPNDVYRSTV